MDYSKWILVEQLFRVNGHDLSVAKFSIMERIKKNTHDISEIRETKDD